MQREDVEEKPANKGEKDGAVYRCPKIARGTVDF
jgi:hypothetical protein